MRVYILPLAAGLVCTVAASSVALAPNQVAEVAKAVTVSIQTERSIGSGVTIAKTADRYIVLTAAHVVRDTSAKYQVITPDGRRYEVNRQTVQILPGADLAIVQFVSTQNYRVVKIRTATAISEGSSVYVAGFPQSTSAISQSLFNFTEGRVTACSRQPLSGGYGLVYTNLTLPGMSGGSVLNDRGELIAIHGRGDVEKSSTASTINSNIQVKTGFNLGILANVFLPAIAKTGLKVEAATSPPNDVANNTSTNSSDALVSVVAKIQSGDYPGALVELDRQIATHPRQASAYYLRASLNQMMGNSGQILPDLNRSIELDPKNPQAYYLRGNILYGNQDLTGALTDFDRVIQLDPKYKIAYTLRAIVFMKQGNLIGELDTYNKSIAVDPNSAEAYDARAGVQIRLNNIPAAIADLSQSITLNPRNISTYELRASFRISRGDIAGAIADHSKVIELSPNHIRSYLSRAGLYTQQQNLPKALADYASVLKINPNEYEAWNKQLDIYNQLANYPGAVKALDGLIRIYPNNANYFYQRAGAKIKLRDKTSAIEDYRQAIDIYRQQGDRNMVENLTNELRDLKAKAI
jgi:tetratricopeptide (TPR) repeat protein/V8-like Glu-specific endopeptidase